eukprot:766170-Hanusia_phi.AAC.1
MSSSETVAMGPVEATRVLQSFMVYWGHVNALRLRKALHREIHKIHLEPEACRYMKLFQAELMSSLGKVSYSQCRNHVQGACTGGNRSTWATELAHSFMYVPILHWKEGQNSIEQLEGVRPELDQDKGDRTLTEMLIALYLIFKDDRKVSQIKVVLPILLSDKGSQPFSRQALEGLSNAVSLETCRTAARELNLIGAGEYSEIFQRLQRWSIKQAVTNVLYGVDDVKEWNTTLSSQYCVFEEPCCLVPHGSADSDAMACASLVGARQTEAFAKYVNTMVERYSKHTCHGGAASDILEEHGLRGSFLEVFSAFRYQPHAPGSLLVQSGYLGKAWKTESCIRNPAVQTKDVYPDETSTKKFHQFYKSISQDIRFQSLEKQLYHFKDIEADGILAMMTTNCIETGILKLPTQLAMLGLCCLYALMGYHQVLMLCSEDRWLYQPEARKPFLPKTLRITRVLDPTINYIWAIGVILSIHKGRTESPLLGKKIIALMVLVGGMLYLTSAISDYIQCKFYGGGVGSACNGTFSMSASFAVFCVFLGGQLAQKYVWVMVYSVQGAYIFYTTSLNRSWSSWAKMFFRFYGGIILTLVPVILLRYRIALRQAHRDMALQTAKIECVWNRIFKSEMEAIKDLAWKAERVSAKLKTTYQAARKLRSFWDLLTSEQPLRFSRRGKILQLPQDIEKTYEQAQLVSPFFQMLMQSWNPVGCIHPGGLKKSSRAVQKVVRCYSRDPSHLTDLVRSTVIVKNLSELNRWLERLLGSSTIARHVGVEEEEEVDDFLLCNTTQLMSGDRRILKKCST